jgi:chromatin structure-remodeling complex subunit RSC1/2
MRVYVHSQKKASLTLYSGTDPSILFHKKVNKRIIPEYYETIKEPIALSIVKQKINSRAYQSIREFVRDFALIPFNAQVFNRPDSGAFQDALIIKSELEKQLQKLVETGVIKKEDSILPDLGEIPTYEDPPTEEVEDAGDDEEESDEEGEEDEDDEDDEGGKKKRKGPRGNSSASKREALGDDDGKKARGRPPKLMTPMEARIQAILKGIRKPKNKSGQLIIRDFDRLPDKLAMPEYYMEIKNPMAYDVLKRKVKRKKYKSLEEFMIDVNVMFNNAKEYNTDDSEIYQNAVTLQVEAGHLYDIEKAKDDSDFADEEGKIPVPHGILHNGELYKVGDWVHIRNPNDLTKPVPAQIYRTYQSQDKKPMVNVCWYYRPEQTVHRFDKHFLADEVVKTGRYRDHSIDEVEGRCFVMFTTRYFKGRPRRLPPNIEMYVCEARYNEERHQFNKIKTWASCLPDEVRDQDYEMDLFDHPRKMKKFPSPIAYLLRDDQTETDELPKPTWGAEGAPPKIGAVHRRPRGDKDSPPPEPTPPPPPKMPTPPPRQIPQPAPSYQPSPAIQTQPSPRQLSVSARPSYGASHPQSYTQQPSASPAPVRPPSTQPSLPPSTPQQALARPPMQHVQSSYTSQHAHSATVASTGTGYAPRPPTATSHSYRDPPAIETYVLPDQANLSIPSEIRERYQRDELGRVIFFTTPPVIPSQPTGSVQAHSVRYLAEKARRATSLAKKRNASQLEKQASECAAKKVRVAQVEQAKRDLESMQRRALGELEAQLASSIVGELDDSDLARLNEGQKAASKQLLVCEVHERLRAESRRVQLDNYVFGDDWDGRLG